MLDKQILLLISLSYIQVFTLDKGVNKNIPKWKKQVNESYSQSNNIARLRNTY